MSDKYALRARDIMSPDPIYIGQDKTVLDAILVMRAKKIRSLIIDRLDDNDAYGIVTYTDIVTKVFAEGRDPAQTRLADIAIKPLIVINPSLRVELVARLFARTGISHAPVLSEHKIIGVISKADLVQNLV
jgi:predicted transcriptional regulator